MALFFYCCWQKQQQKNNNGTSKNNIAPVTKETGLTSRCGSFGWSLLIGWSLLAAQTTTAERAESSELSDFEQLVWTGSGMWTDKYRTWNARKCDTLLGCMWQNCNSWWFTTKNRTGSDVEICLNLTSLYFDRGECCNSVKYEQTWQHTECEFKVNVTHCDDVCENCETTCDSTSRVTNPTF